jgi:hypothetical protein
MNEHEYDLVRTVQRHVDHHGDVTISPSMKHAPAMKKAGMLGGQQAGPKGDVTMLVRPHGRISGKKCQAPRRTYSWTMRCGRKGGER